MTCEVPNCKRKVSRLMETVGWGKAIYSCGYCCKFSRDYYVKEYGIESVIEVKSPNHWKPVEYHEDYSMVWCKL